MNNALKYVKILEGTGITREQAEAHVQIITEITEGDLATKQDLSIFGTTLLQGSENLRNSLNQDMKNLDGRLSKSIENLDIKFSQQIKNLDTKLDNAVEKFEHKLLQSEYRLTIKLGTIVTVAIAAATTVIKLL